MEVKLYVGNLSYQTTAEQLQSLFAEAGSVTQVDLIKDRDTGSSRGFAFITMASQTDANQAIQKLNGYALDGRDLRVSVAQQREERPSYGDPRGGDRRRRR